LEADVSDDLHKRIADCAAEYGINLQRRYVLKDVCSFLGRDRKTVYGYRKAGHLPHSYQGKKKVWPGFDIVRFIIGEPPAERGPAPEPKEPHNNGGGGLHGAATRTFKPE
jgi:hypothetical protein